MTAYEISLGLVGSEMCIRDRYNTTPQETRGFPTYLLVSNPDGEFSILGDIRGGMEKGKFRERLSTLLDKFR